jgi:hypothetical protein
MYDPNLQVLEFHFKELERQAKSAKGNFGGKISLRYNSLVSLLIVAGLVSALFGFLPAL